MARRSPHGLRSALALASAALLAVLILPACSERDDGPGIPAAVPIPAAVQVPSGNALKVRLHAVGLQVYAWSAATGHWGPAKPLATLFRGDVLAGVHAEGPLWKHNDGSMVAGAKVASATVDPAAIPWLLLKAESRSGPGLFADVTYVQRINTRGGLAPEGPGSADGAEIQVHYEADYLFFHAQ